MSMRYMHLLRDNALLAHLAKKRNIEPLEHILRKEAKHFEEICKGSTSFGPLVKPEQLELILEKAIEGTHKIFAIEQEVERPKIKSFKLFDLKNPVAKEVLGNYTKGFVGLTLASASLPIMMITGSLLAGATFLLGLVYTLNYGLGLSKHLQYKKGTYYSYPHQTINIEKNEELLCVQADTVHEYTHHLQNRYMHLDPLIHRGLIKGIARCTTRLVTNQWYKDEGNISILFPAHSRTYGELKSTYIWLCQTLNHKVKKELIKLPSPVDYIETAHLSEVNHPSPYAIGNTFLCIAELKKGIEIYPEMLRNNYELVLEDYLK